MVITDTVYSKIREQIAAHPPERGGALYGPRNYPFVTHFEFDPDGLTSEVSYVPSTRLIDSVTRVELEKGLQFKGIVHSHPRGVIRPSTGDEQTVGSYFRLNPHVSQMSLPIVQPLRPLRVGDAKDDQVFLHWYRAERTGPATRQMTSAIPASPWTQPYAALNRFGARARPEVQNPPVQVLPDDLHVLPLREHMDRLVSQIKRLGGVNLVIDPKPQSLKVRNAELVGLSASASDTLAAHELYFFVSIDYPIVPPVVLRAHGTSTSQLHFHWEGLGDLEIGIDSVAQAFLRPN